MLKSALEDESDFIVLDNGKVKVTGQLVGGKEIVIEGHVEDIHITKESADYYHSDLYFPQQPDLRSDCRYKLYFKREGDPIFTVTERNTPMKVEHIATVEINELTPKAIEQARRAADVSDDTVFEVHGGGNNGFGFTIVFKWSK